MDNDIDRILNSIDGMSQAYPSPFFYNKIAQKLKRSEKNVWERWSGLIARPAVLAAGFVLLMILNLSSIIISGKHKVVDQQAAVDADNYEQLSYGASTYFDYENGMP
jgi:hypothetical protein